MTNAKPKLEDGPDVTGVEEAPVPVEVMLPPSDAIQVWQLTVAVRADSRWDIVQSAGRHWSKVPTIVPSDDPDLAELRACALLEVSG